MDDIKRKLDALTEFLEHSGCEDYGVEYTIDLDRDGFNVNFKRHDRKKTLEFIVDENNQVKVCMYEDIYEEVCWHNWTLYRFWIALMEWF